MATARAGAGGQPSRGEAAIDESTRRAVDYETIKTETHGRVALLRLDRPRALNALNARLIGELADALTHFEADAGIGCMVLTGSAEVFAAGADVKELRDKTVADAYLDDFLAHWDALSRARKPIVAAVAGYALGGGCELAMMCDFILAADTAKFGQPEIKLGVIPGSGGTQRLVRSIGKSKAMEMVLTGRLMGAEEAERSGLVARVLPADRLLDEAIKTAQTIAAMSLPAVLMAKEAVERAYETPLAEGVRYERRLFYSLFATKDQKEGMTAFIEKRTPQFEHK
jgi:enoyl-CoA hydratase